jgi:hypothetical protein
MFASLAFNHQLSSLRCPEALADIAVASNENAQCFTRRLGTTVGSRWLDAKAIISADESTPTTHPLSREW